MASRDYPLSASQLKTWKRCPKSYEFKYKDVFKPTKAPKGYRSMGSAVHESIENVMECNPDLRDEEQLNWRFTEELMDLDYDYPEAMHDNVMTCIANAARYISDRDDAEIRGLEVDHEFTVNRPDISYPFRAIMDVCTDTEIWDWKTGKRRKKDETIQAAVYLAAYTNKYGEVPEAIRFVYLKEREVGTISRTDNEGNEFWSLDEQPNGWDEVIDLAKQILRGWETDEFPAKPDEGKCYWCDYEIFCPASKVGVGGENPMKLLYR